MKRKFEESEPEQSQYIIEVEGPMQAVMMYYAGGSDLKIISSISKKEYYFKTGVPTAVDPADVEEFLAMTKEAGCCGYIYKMHLFEKA